MTDSDYARRLAALRASLPAAGVDALLVTHPPNIRYLTGLDLSQGMLLVARTGGALVVDGRYITAARERFGAIAALRTMAVVQAERSLEERFASHLAGSLPLRTIGVEAASLTVSRFDRLGRLLAVALGSGGDPACVAALQPTERIVERLRAVKDAAEIAIMREAARQLSEVARRVPGLLASGRTERAIAADIDAALRRAGFERPAFDTIVASGPNSSLPHARPTTRRLEAGEGVVLDFGGVYDGYCVDLTRTVQLPPVSDAFAALFEAVSAARMAAVAAVRPGVRAGDVDAAARAVLEARGFGEAFLHGTGHGLGLEVHEEPRISRAGAGNPDEPLLEGMVFTIEPGAYVPGVGGVRIEDDALVTAGGCELLTDVPIDRGGWGLSWDGSAAAPRVPVERTASGDPAGDE